VAPQPQRPLIGQASMWQQPFTSEVAIGYIASFDPAPGFPVSNVTVIRSISRQAKWYQY